MWQSYHVVKLLATGLVRVRLGFGSGYLRSGLSDKVVRSELIINYA